MSNIRAVVFDVGETLIDESRVWGRWADWMGVSKLTFFTVLGATIARGQPQSHAFAQIDPAFQPWAEIQRRRAAGEDDCEPDERDLYPDVIECIEALKQMDIRVAVAGNQFVQSETWLSRVRPAFDLIGSSERWGVQKPSKAFFTRLTSELAIDAAECVYVGDRLDNDIIPAAAAGLRPILLRRGPWGHILSDGAEVNAPVVNSLVELPEAVRRLNG